MDKAPLVSIVIPFRNRRHLLRRTLASISAQTYRPVQLLLVDNRSTDGSTNVAAQFACSHQAPDFRIELISCSKSGAAAARNAGLAHAKGKYVYFFDSDDEMAPDCLSIAVGQAEVARTCDIVVCHTRIIKRDGSKEVRRYGYFSRPSHQILTGFLSTQSVLYRKSFILKVGAWDESLPYWNDWELGVRLLLSEPHIRFIRHKVFHKIYAHADSITGSDLHSRLPYIRKALKAVAADLSRVPSPHARSAIRALGRRQAIVAAHLWAEGAHDAAQSLLADSIAATGSMLERAFRRLLYHYTRLGGRGAWRIA